MMQDAGRNIQYFTLTLVGLLILSQGIPGNPSHALWVVFS